MLSEIHVELREDKVDFSVSIHSLMYTSVMVYDCCRVVRRV